MNPQDPFSQPQGGTQPYAGPPHPGQPSIQPQVPTDPLYDAAPVGASMSAQPVGYGVGMAPAPSTLPQPSQPPVAASPAPQAAAPVQPMQQSLYTLPPKPSKLWMIIAIITIVTTVGLGAAFVWSMLQYIDQRDNVTSKVTSAVAEAVKEQADKDAAAFLEKEKQPNRLFVGPDDYGRVSFNYPKTWSAYVERDAIDGGNYVAYLNPVLVPRISNQQQVALRVLIEEKDYDKVLDSYSTLVKKGDLKTSAVKADDQNGTRIDGQFTKDVRGSAVIFKIRDKTVTIRTDAEVFRGDFDALVKTITFNK